MKIIRVKAVQAHAVPKTVHNPRGPFPPEMQGYNPGYIDISDGIPSELELDRYDEDSHPAAQPEIIYDYAPEANEDGSGFELGATAQNDFKPEKYYRCKYCNFRVAEHEIEEHECED
jgi:hypothetical protein